MGSVASYEASLVAVYKRKIKISEPNTQEKIEKFLDSKKGIFGKVEKDIIDFEDIDFSNQDHIGYVYYYDGEETSTFKFEADIRDYIDEDCEDIRPIVAISPEELKFLDLKVLKDYDYYDEEGDFNENISLADVSGWIYCSNDNSERQKVKLSKKILQDLIEGNCTLYLEGDGTGEHC